MIKDRNYASAPFREHNKIQKYASFFPLWPTITNITWVQFICSTYHQVKFKMNYLLHNLKIKLRHPVIYTHIENTVNKENQTHQITKQREMENKHNVYSNSSWKIT